MVIHFSYFSYQVPSIVHSVEILNSSLSLMCLVNNSFFSYFFSSFYYCSGWGYIMAFIKVLTIYQLYYIWTQPLHHSPSSPSPLSFHFELKFIIANFTRENYNGTIYDYKHLFTTTPGNHIFWILMHVHNAIYFSICSFPSDSHFLIISL
jgi:hypothetical protein